MSQPEKTIKQAEKAAQQAEKAGENKLQDLVEEDADSTDSNVRYGSRYTAYTSDIGEAFRPVVPPYIVTAAYGVSWAYLIGDVAFTTYKSRQLGPSPLEAANMNEPTRLSLVAVKRSVFQGVASMALPAFTIHTAVKQASKAVRNSPNVQLKRWGPTAVGLGIVPALPFLFDHPVEKAVDVAFEKIEEQWFRHNHPDAPVPSADPPLSKRDL